MLQQPTKVVPVLPTSLTRAAGLLAVGLALSLSACSGGGGGGGGAADSTGPSSNAESSSQESSTSPVPPGDPVEDVCALLSTKDVSGILQNDMVATATPHTCTYTPSSGDGPPQVITVQPDPGGALDTARADSEAALNGVAQPVEVAGNKGYAVFGLQGETILGQGAVSVNGRIVTTSVIGGGPGDLVSIVLALLELAVESL